MHVNHGRQRAPVSGQNVAHVIATRVRRVDAAPSQKLGAPGDIGVFAVDEKVGIEKFVSNRDIVYHLAAIESGRGGGAEDVFVLPIMAVGHFLASAVEGPGRGGG